jgi:hypothetical protein
MGRGYAVFATAIGVALEGTGPIIGRTLFDIVRPVALPGPYN